MKIFQKLGVAALTLSAVVLSTACSTADVVVIRPRPPRVVHKRVVVVPKAPKKVWVPGHWNQGHWITGHWRVLR